MQLHARNALEIGCTYTYGEGPHAQGQLGTFRAVPVFRLKYSRQSAQWYCMGRALGVTLVWWLPSLGHMRLPCGHT